MMDTIATLKPGDTYAIAIDLTLDGVPQDLRAVDISSDVRTRGGAAAWTCAVDVAPDGLSATLSATPEQTAAAPRGLLESDIVYTWPDGTVETTPTFAIQLTRRITQ